MLKRQAFIGSCIGAVASCWPLDSLAATKRHSQYTPRPRFSGPRTTGIAYVVCSETNSLTVIDLAHPTIASTIPVGSSPTHVVLDRRLHRAYVSNFGANSISVYDRATGTIVSAFESLSGPAAMALDETSGILYTCNVLSGTINAIDTANGKHVGGAILGTHPNDIAADFAARRLYVVNAGSGTVSYIDIAGTRFVAKSVAADAAADSIALARDGQTAFIANSAAGTVSILDIPKRRIKATIGGFHQPHAMTIASETRMYVAESGSSSVAVVDIEGAAIISRIDVGGMPLVVRANAAGDRLFAVNYEAQTVTIVDPATAVVIETLRGFGKPRNFAIDG